MASARQHQPDLNVGDLMGPAVTVGDRTPLRQVAHDMLERQVEAVVIVDRAGALCGLITEEGRVPGLLENEMA